LKIGKNGWKVVVFEPFFLVSIRCAQPDSASFNSDAGDRTQPLVPLRRLDPFFDGSYGFAPEC